MDRKFISRDGRVMGGHYVEVIGPDGVKHHVGPFKSRARAREWIMQHWPRQAPERKKVA